MARAAKPLQVLQHTNARSTGKKLTRTTRNRVTATSTTTTTTAVGQTVLALDLVATVQETNREKKRLFRVREY